MPLDVNDVRKRLTKKTYYIRSDRGLQDTAWTDRDHASHKSMADHNVSWCMYHGLNDKIRTLLEIYLLF